MKQIPFYRIKAYDSTVVHATVESRHADANGATDRVSPAASKKVDTP